MELPTPDESTALRWAAESTFDGTYYPAETKNGGESDRHFHALRMVVGLLERHFAKRPDVYVGAKKDLYCQIGGVDQVVTADVLVAFGTTKAIRFEAFDWKELGAVLPWILEIGSVDTWRDDVDGKLKAYQDVLRVPEFFFFGTGLDLFPHDLLACRLVEGRYRPIAPRIAGPRPRFMSETLGLGFEPDGDVLRIWDPVAGRHLQARGENDG